MPQDVLLIKQFYGEITNVIVPVSYAHVISYIKLRITV